MAISWAEHKICSKLEEPLTGVKPLQGSQYLMQSVGLTGLAHCLPSSESGAVQTVYICVAGTPEHSSDRFHTDLKLNTQPERVNGWWLRLSFKWFFFYIYTYTYIVILKIILSSIRFCLFLFVCKQCESKQVQTSDFRWWWDVLWT